jgi:solute carrier family 50 protein (sugar transporter)
MTTSNLLTTLSPTTISLLIPTNNNNNTQSPSLSSMSSNTHATSCGWEYDQSWLNLLGLFGAIAVLSLWAAPIKDIWTGTDSVWATKSTARVATAFPYLASIFNCVLWQIYSVKNPAQFIVPIFVNTAGFIFNVGFVWCWYKFADENGKQKTRQQTMFFVLYSLVTLVLWAATRDIEVEGYCAAVVNTMMVFGPLAAAGQVIRTRSVQGMPFLPLICTLISSLVWSGYGLYICNVQVMIPNGFGILFGILQLSLYGWAKNQEAKVQLLSQDSFRATTPMAETALDDDSASTDGHGLGLGV